MRHGMAVLVAMAATLPGAAWEIRLFDGASLHVDIYAAREQANTFSLVMERTLRFQRGLRGAYTEQQWPKGTNGGDKVALVFRLLRDDVLPPDPGNYTLLSEESYAVRAREKSLVLMARSTRGAIFALGHLYRTAEFFDGGFQLPDGYRVVETPAYPLRGHQLGYRQKSNTYDAWKAEDYEFYIQDLMLFGANAIENIPFETAPSPHFEASPEAMNRELSKLCAKYDLQYWVWTPATFDLSDEAQREEASSQHRELYKDCERLDAVFFPGGDPGNNPPELVLPFLEALTGPLLRVHPEAKIWLSMQGFTPAESDYVYDYLDRGQPDWFGGLVAGPSSPPIPETRARLHARYGLRHYPDMTHTIRSQYPTPWWDPAFAYTQGREPINPEPARYRDVHNHFAPYTIGFITYSDGVNDDVNKAVWSALGWDPETPIRELLQEYNNLYLGNIRGAEDAILQLEQNWRGPLAENGGVTALRNMIKNGERYEETWRGQMIKLRALYDYWLRERLAYETHLEHEANQELLASGDIGKALAILARAESDIAPAPNRGQIIGLGDALFEKIGMQLSVERHQASDPQRGAIIDYLDYPLNNRFWLEAELEKAQELDEEAREARLIEIATWENPVPGSFYDDIGNVSKSPRVVRGEETNTDPVPQRAENPDFMWWDKGYHAYRQSWVSKMDWPNEMRYVSLDPDARYQLWITGYGKCLLNADGERLTPEKERVEIGEKNFFDVPQALTADRELVLTFDTPYEPNINWRQQSRLTEIWLVPVIDLE